MNHVRPRVSALLSVALALLGAACADETRSVPTAAVAEAATLAAKRTTALRGNIDITGITLETRYWNPANGVPSVAAAAATYGGLPTGTPGYTYPAVQIPNVGSAPSVLITADGCAQATPVRHPGTASQNIATRISITLNSKGASSIGIRFGVDARGAVVLVDGVPVASHMNDPWWGGYFLSDESLTATPLWVTNPWGVMEVLPLDLGSGAHTIEVIGFEDGNDFGTGGQIDLGAGYQDIVGPIPLKTLTVSKIGGGVGSVASLPAGISCGADCTEPYNFGTAVTLTASATPPSVFAGWDGACRGMSTSCTMTMDADRVVSAKFVTPPTVTAMTIETRYWQWNGPQPTAATAVALFNSLPTNRTGYTNAPVPVATMVNNQALFTAPNVGVNGELGTRTVITLSTASAMVVQMRATVDYAAGGGVWLDGTMVTGVFGSAPGTLAAALNLGAGTHTVEVLGFEDCCDGMPRLEFDYGLGWVVVTAPLPPPQRLTVTAGAAGGRVTSVPSGIDCGTVCVADFTAGSQVTLSATVNAGYFFTGWSGSGCAGSETTCVVRMNSAQFMTANFVQNTLTVVRAGTGAGSVVSSPAGINCGATCNADYPLGAVVTLSATPDATSDLGSWSIPTCTGNTCTVTMQGSRTVTVDFVRRTHALTVSKTGTGAGTVTSAPSGISCGANCTASFAEGTSVVLTAAPATGSDFTGWTGAGCSGTGSCTVPMSQVQGVTATFARAADSEPPVISCKATPNVLWPVNSKLIQVKVKVNLTDASPASFKLLSVVSSEPARTPGGGSTSADIVDWDPGSDDVEGLLRAERAGNLKDRVYTLTYRGTDVRGNRADASCTVTVPHDQR